MWLPSVAKCDTKLLLNHGQHLDIPCLIKNKTNRLFVGISHKKTDVQYCKIGEDEVAKLLEKIKCPICDGSYNRTNKSRHLKSKKHLNKMT